jgi:hypothetical protein
MAPTAATEVLQGFLLFTWRLRPKQELIDSDAINN